MPQTTANRPTGPPSPRLPVSGRVVFGLVCAVGLVAVVAAVLFVAERPSSAADIAERLAGERWYAVMFRHRPVGHYHANTGRTALGHFEFQTELHFRLAGDVPTRMEDSLVFHRESRRIRWSARSTRLPRARTRQTRVVIEDGVAAISDGPQQRQSDFAGELPMDDYLAIERWLAEDEPGVGETRSARAVDFDRLAVVADTWSLLARDADGVEVGKDSLADTTFVRMDNDFVPQRMQIGALFSLEAVADERLARLWERRPPVFSSSQSVAVDRPIRRPHALTRLVVALSHSDDEVPSWIAAMPSVLTSDTVAPLYRRSRRRHARIGEATVSYPADDPNLVALAERRGRGLGGRSRPGDGAGRLRAWTPALPRHRSRGRCPGDHAPAGRRLHRVR